MQTSVVNRGKKFRVASDLMKQTAVIRVKIHRVLRVTKTPPRRQKKIKKLFWKKNLPLPPPVAA